MTDPFPQGYYGNGGEYQFTNVVGGKCQPWNPTVNVVIKPILDPIAMYACNVGLLGAGIVIPAKNSPVGFDLEANDWVVPYGKGTISDLIFKVTEKVPFVNYHQPFDITWTLSFSNKGDGIKLIKPSEATGGTFPLPRYAPESGYKTNLDCKIATYADGTGLDPQINAVTGYFFRVRTVLDETGNQKCSLWQNSWGYSILG